MRVSNCTSIFTIALVLSIATCKAQLAPSPTPEAPPSVRWTDWLGTSSTGKIRARLRDQSTYGPMHSAAVEVEVQNIFLSSVEVPAAATIHRGVLRYQLDGCAPVTTTDTRLRFDQLSSGDHTITVAILGLDNRLLTPDATLRLKVP